MTFVIIQHPDLGPTASADGPRNASRPRFVGCGQLSLWPIWHTIGTAFFHTMSPVPHPNRRERQGGTYYWSRNLLI
jgi:hypothetical protein